MASRILIYQRWLALVIDQITDGIDCDSCYFWRLIEKVYKNHLTILSVSRIFEIIKYTLEIKEILIMTITSNAQLNSYYYYWFT